MKKITKVVLSFLLVLSLLPIGNNVQAYFVQDNTTNNSTKSSPIVYDIYATLGTLPTLYAGLNTYTSNNESYMWFLRKGTLNTTYLPSHVNFIAPNKEYDAELMNEIIDKVKELFTLNPDAKFNFYIDDLRVQFILQSFVANHIPEDNYKVFLLSDGTATYTKFKSMFNAAGTYPTWTKYADDFMNRKTRIAAGEKDVININNDTEMHPSMYFVSQFDNVEYRMQFPELLVSNDDNVKTEISKMNTIKTAPYDIYNDLSDDKKAAFVKAAGVDKQKFDGIFDASSKPNLIISGTSLAGEQNGFEEVVKNIVKDYGKQYALFFKPHPAWDPISNPQLIDLKRKEFLNGLGITILPAQLPMEALLWAYPDLKIGGYSSTLYMSTAKEQTLFFIADSKDKLVSPLPELYDLGHFGNAKFYKVVPDPDNGNKDSDTALSLLELSHNDEKIPLNVTEAVYTANVPNKIDKVKLTLKTDEEEDKIQVHFEDKDVNVSNIAGTYQSEDLLLNVGVNTILVTVLSFDGKNTNTYKVVISRDDEKTEGNGDGNVGGDGSNPGGGSNPGDGSNPGSGSNSGGSGASNSNTTIPSGSGGVVNTNSNVIEVLANGKKKDEIELSKIKHETKNAIVDILDKEVTSIKVKSNILKELKNNKIEIVTFNLDGFSYQVPVDILEQINYQSQGSNKETELNLSFDINKDVNSNKVEMLGEMISNLYDVSLKITDDKGLNKEVKDIGKYVSIKVLLKNVTGQDKAKIAAISLSKDINGSPISHTKPVKLINQNGKYYALISTMNYGSFLVLKNDKKFKDVVNHWASHDITEAANRNIVNGKGEELFLPNTHISRAEFISMMVRGMGVSPAKTKTDKWYDDEVAVAEKIGLLKNLSISSSDIEKNITRSEIVSIVTAAYSYINNDMGLKVDEKILAGFVDINKLTDLEQSEFAWCIENKIINGLTTDNSGKVSLSPSKESTRAEATTILIRTLRSLSLID
jgi:S-layer homology domain/Cadherin-like beta sandwich domain